MSGGEKDNNKKMEFVRDFSAIRMNGNPEYRGSDTGNK